MATSASFYINGPSLEAATAVFTDSSLLTCAADGFYSDGVISREQVGCVLLPQQTCPSCSTAFSLGYSEVDCATACSETPVTYYSSCTELVLYYCYLWTDAALTIEAPAGYYSDGINCYDYRFPHTGIISITACSSPSDAVVAFDFFNDGSGSIRARATVTSGTTLDNLVITGSVNGYQSLGCSGTLIVQPSLTDTLSAGSPSVSTEIFGSISAIVSSKYYPLIVNGNTITTASQNITVGANTYTITGATSCYSPL